MKRMFSSTDSWKNQALKELKGKKELSSSALYTSLDLEDIEIEESLPGFFPFTRGVKSTMYTGRPWTIRQYSGFSTARETNKFYQNNLKAGQKGLSVAFDLPTQRGYDSDDKKVVSDVGKAGVAIDTVEDMKILFDKIPLDKISVSMTMNGAVLPILASYIVAAEEQGVDKKDLSGTIQNDILKEFMVRNTYIYPPSGSMRIVGDVIEYISNNMPKFNSISVSGYHMQESGATIAQELAFTLGNGLEYVREAINRGMDIDSFAPKISFFFGTGMNFYNEVAKLRAARVIWANLIKQFNPKKEQSMMMRTHCQTSGWSLAQQDPYNNIIRTTIEAMSSIFGGTQSLHTNAFDEALGLPTATSARIARNTQLILREETGITEVIDPFAGSYMMETLADTIITEVMQKLDNIDNFGGMTKYIESGAPKQLIEESATKRQAMIDCGEEVIVGVNKYQSSNEDNISVREIDNITVRDEQLKYLDSIKQYRDQSKIDHILNQITEATKDDKKNLLELSIEAMRLRATVGEVSFAIEKIYGRYKAPIKTTDKSYNEFYNDKEKLNLISQRINFITQRIGTKPKILVAKIGQDGHDRGYKVIATSFSDFGFDVVVGPLFQTSNEVVINAIKNSVHIIGVSILSGDHISLVSQIMKDLKKYNRQNIIVVVGGIIPSKDYGLLEDIGVSSIFGPGTVVIDAANSVLDCLDEKIVV